MTEKSINNIINQARSIFGDRFDFIRTDEWNYSKIYLHCNECNCDFEVHSNTLLNGKFGGCKSCEKKHKERELIKKINEIYGSDRFDCSLIDYKGAREPVILICKKCGSKIEINPDRLGVASEPCKKCASKSNRDLFVLKSKEKWGDRFEFVNFDEEYESQLSKISVKCNDCGKVFTVKASNFLYSMKGCPLCGSDKTWTNEEFITRAKECFGDIYDYSLVDYKGNRIPVKIKCNLCGEIFDIAPYNFLHSQFGVHVCKGVQLKDFKKNFGKKIGTKKSKSQSENFISRSKRKFGDKFDYKRIDEWTSEKIFLKCHDCDAEFETTPDQHIAGKHGGCENCKRLEQERYFINKAKERHGDKFDFSLVHYVDDDTPVKIKCNKCGTIFEALPKNVKKYNDICKNCVNKKNKDNYFDAVKLKFGAMFDFTVAESEFTGLNSYINVKCNKCGEFFKVRAGNFLYSTKGCPKCTNIRHRTTEDFIKVATEKFGDKFDYSEVNYKNQYTPVKIYCKECKEYFTVVPAFFLTSIHGCPKCAKRHAFMTKDEFVKKAREIHGDKYDYSEVCLNGVNNSYIKIYCKKCNKPFIQRAINHLCGHGCPNCSNSSSSMEVELYEEIKNNYLGNIIRNDRTVLHPKELDLYFPSGSLAVEMNGNYWHSTASRSDNRHMYHKYLACDKLGIELLSFYEDEWKFNKDYVLSIIRKKLGVNFGSFDSKYKSVEKVDINKALVFFDKNDINGRPKHIDEAYGLYDDDKLIAVAGINIKNVDGKNIIEIERLTEVLDIIVYNWIEKVISFIRDNHENVSSITYVSNNRFCEDLTLLNNGFNFVKNIDPDFYYIQVRGPEKDCFLRRYSRRKVELSVINGESSDIDGKTEEEVAVESGFERLYDCGKKVWSFRL